MEFIGWMGAILLALCGLPELIIAIKTGTSTVSYAMLLMWLFGEIFALIYTINKNKKVKLLPLLFNYGLNIVIITAILIIKVSSGKGLQILTQFLLS